MADQNDSKTAPQTQVSDADKAHAFVDSVRLAQAAPDLLRALQLLLLSSGPRNTSALVLNDYYEALRLANDAIAHALGVQLEGDPRR